VIGTVALRSLHGRAGGAVTGNRHSPAPPIATSLPPQLARITIASESRAPVGTSGWMGL
jgi:hypothetical protein